MATPCVENVPVDICQGLRKRAKKNGHSMAAEVLAILRQSVQPRPNGSVGGSFTSEWLISAPGPHLTPGPLALAEEMTGRGAARFPVKWLGAF